MGHLLGTLNPEAVKRMEDTRPVPGVGDWILYYPRPGEVRRGRRAVPALVLHRDPENPLLDLLVVLGREDELELEKVPEQTNENERGWRRKDEAAAIEPASAPALAPDGGEMQGLREDLDKLRGAIYGDVEEAPGSVLELIDALDERLDKVERAMSRPAIPAPKARKGKKRGK